MELRCSDFFDWRWRQQRDCSDGAKPPQSFFNDFSGCAVMAAPELEAWA